jgi:hypothetical protein
MPQVQCKDRCEHSSSSMAANSSVAVGCAAISHLCNRPGPSIRFTRCLFGAAVTLSSRAARELLVEVASASVP